MNTLIDRTLRNRSVRARNKRDSEGTLGVQMERLFTEARRRHEAAESLLGLALKEWLDRNEPSVSDRAVRKGL